MMAHGDAREGKWMGNWRMECVASPLHTTSKLGVSSITTADAHTSAASSRLNWCPCRFKWTRLFRRKMISGFCVCAITFQMQSTLIFVIQKWELDEDVEPSKISVKLLIARNRHIPQLHRPYIVAMYTFTTTTGHKDRGPAVAYRCNCFSSPSICTATTVKVRAKASLTTDCSMALVCAGRG